MLGGQGSATTHRRDEFLDEQGRLVLGRGDRDHLRRHKPLHQRVALHRLHGREVPERLRRPTAFSTRVLRNDRGQGREMTQRIGLWGLLARAQHSWSPHGVNQPSLFCRRPPIRAASHSTWSPPRRWP